MSLQHLISNHSGYPKKKCFGHITFNFFPSDPKHTPQQSLLDKVEISQVSQLMGLLVLLRKKALQTFMQCEVWLM